MSVLVVAPALNEGVIIGQVVREALAVDLVTDVLVVDDGSTDATAGIAEEAGAIVLRHPENRGVGAAIRSGICFARDHGYEVLAVVAGDGQHDPAELPRALIPVLEGWCDLTQGSRFAPGGRITGRRDPRAPLIRIYSRLFQALSGVALTDATNGFRAFRPGLFADAGIDLDGPGLDQYQLEPYLLYSAARCGLRIHEVPCTVRYPEDRAYSHMKPIRDWWKLMSPLLSMKVGGRR